MTTSSSPLVPKVRPAAPSSAETPGIGGLTGGPHAHIQLPRLRPRQAPLPAVPRALQPALRPLNRSAFHLPDHPSPAGRRPSSACCSPRIRFSTHDAPPPPPPSPIAVYISRSAPHGTRAESPTPPYPGKPNPQSHLCPCDLSDLSLLVILRTHPNSNRPTKMARSPT